MKPEGRRESTNVEDRRGKSGGRKASLGIGEMIVVGLLMWIMGGNSLDGDTFAPNYWICKELFCQTDT
ncbi:hypothetical protein [Tannerella forsythia]|uniref:hypothetical protein n=1 Tax=Tannerella forsythia TaxID=28112 RepID=UPI000618AB1B|nr:hypothetical protein [Tannerella forsythia]BAR49524.1 hypothetical protein TF3313_2060 [Tannerella forsythia 3313]